MRTIFFSFPSHLTTEVLEYNIIPRGYYVIEEISGYTQATWITDFLPSGIIQPSCLQRLHLDLVIDEMQDQDIRVMARGRQVMWHNAPYMDMERLSFSFLPEGEVPVHPENRVIND